MAKIKLTESQLNDVIKKIAKSVLKEDEGANGGTIINNCKVEVLLKKWNNRDNEYGCSVTLTSPNGATYSLNTNVGEKDAIKLSKEFGVRVKDAY